MQSMMDCLQPIYRQDKLFIICENSSTKGLSSQPTRIKYIVGLLYPPGEVHIAQSQYLL